MDYPLHTNVLNIWFNHMNLLTTDCFWPTKTAISYGFPLIIFSNCQIHEESHPSALVLQPDALTSEVGRRGERGGGGKPTGRRETMPDLLWVMGDPWGWWWPPQLTWSTMSPRGTGWELGLCPVQCVSSLRAETICYDMHLFVSLCASHRALHTARAQ